VFEQLLPQEALNRLCQPCGVIERQRQLTLVMLVRAMVMSAGTPGGADQADVWRAYLESEVPRVTRAAVSRGFDEPRERFREELAQRALAYARAQQVDRPGPLSGVTDWSIVDSTTLKVREALLEECPGTGDDAALTGHTVLSVGCGAPGPYHCSPARAHDRPHLQIDDSGRGYGLLAALASARLARLRAGETSDVRFVIRLKDHWKPQGASLARGQVSREFLPGTDLAALLAEDTLGRDGPALDAEVPGGGGTHPRPLRLVGVQTPKGSCVFLTNVPPRIGPLQVADLYRVRWEVDLRITLDKSGPRLDQSDAERPCSLKPLVPASLLASTSAAVLAHQHHLNPHPREAGAPRTEAPLHPRLLALQRAVSCRFIAQAFELQGTAAKRRWDKSAALLT
jgi:putative transposase